MSRSSRALARARRGFTLLEVMVALAILAFLMAAITSTQGSALLQGARVFNLTTATQLLDGVILNIEEKYRLDGFPENSVEDEDCKLPDGFDKFRCSYDLLALDVSGDKLTSLGQAANQRVTGSPLMSALCGGGANGSGSSAGGAAGLLAGANPAQALSALGVNAASLGALQALVDPQFAQLCGVNVARMCMNIPLIASFIPTIIQKAAKSTRKLIVRISWNERGHSEKTLKIETFITSVPAAETQNQAP